MTRIAVCFFGITRSLGYTIASIEQNVLTPAREIGDVRVFAHFYDVESIHNPRSQESGPLRQNEHVLVKPNWLKLEKPDACIDPIFLERVRAYGDEYKDGFLSVRNLVHQLHSLRTVGTAALAWDANLYLFVRPDLKYCNSFSTVLRRAASEKQESIFIPSWAHWGPGLNDRFAICVGSNAARVYSERICLIDEFCAANGKLHAEKLVRFSVRKHGLRVRFFSNRASRVRSNGRIVNENFQDFRWIRLKDTIMYPYRQTLKVWRKFLYR